MKSTYQVKNLIIVLTLVLCKSVMAMWIDHTLPLNPLSYSGGALSYDKTYYNFKGEDTPEAVQYEIDFLLKNNNTHSKSRCTGIIIDYKEETILLTAAHCIKPLESKGDVKITISSTSRKLDFNGFEPFVNPNMFIHQFYLGTDSYTDRSATDVGKIELTGLLGATNNLEPNFAVPIIGDTKPQSDVEQTSPLIIFGGSPYSKLSTTIPDYAFPLQMVIYNYPWKVTGSLNDGYHYIETEFVPKEIYTCFGDSGGPMMIKDKDILYLLGIHTGSIHAVTDKCGYKNKSFVPINTETMKFITKSLK